MYGPSYACCDGYEGVGSPPIVLNGCDYWVVFSIFCVMACSRNMSWQYVNSMNWTLVMGDGVIGVCV